jgi:hypothetical protein
MSSHLQAAVVASCITLALTIAFYRRRSPGNAAMPRRQAAATSHIFFYGSCISSESRARTGLTGRCLPCTVAGFRRTWSASVDLRAQNIVANESILGVTAVSVQPSAPTTRCTGVVVEVPNSELPSFDEREAGYERIRLDRKAVAILATDAGGEDALPPDAVCWIYAHPPGAPTAAAPVLQSYLDVMLLGCAEYGDEFAEEFLRTTTGWGAELGAFIDDRDAPGYVRASVAARASAAKWDGMLMQLAPAALKARVKGPLPS